MEKEPFHWIRKKDDSNDKFRAVKKKRGKRRKTKITAVRVVSND